MSVRTLYLDRGPGEERGVVLLDGRPERLLISRDGHERRIALGATFVARVRKVDATIATAFLELGAGDEAVLPFRPDSRPVEGAALIVEVRSEPRLGKLAVVRLNGEGQGDPRQLTSAPSLLEQLVSLARGTKVVDGSAARSIADDAQTEILATEHPLPGGGSIAIESTRALTAVDVDVGDRRGNDSKRAARQANLAALAETARLLRLKSLGGLIVIDLAGRGHDGTALLNVARAAFGPDNPGVAFGPISRFGTLELTIPRRRPPVADILCGHDGAPSDLTLALALARRIEDSGRTHPGARLTVRCAPAIASAVNRFEESLVLRLGRRFTIAADERFGRERPEVVAQ